MTAVVGLAEHHVVGARLGGEHRVIAGGEAAAAGDPVRLERRHRGTELIGAGKMRAVGAGARDQVGAAVEDERRAGALHRGGERLEAVEQRALVVPGQRQQHGGHLDGGERRRQVSASRAGSPVGGATR